MAILNFFTSKTTTVTSSPCLKAPQRMTFHHRHKTTYDLPPPLQKRPMTFHLVLSTGVLRDSSEHGKCDGVFDVLVAVDRWGDAVDDLRQHEGEEDWMSRVRGHFTATHDWRDACFWKISQELVSKPNDHWVYSLDDTPEKREINQETWNLFFENIIFSFEEFINWNFFSKNTNFLYKRNFHMAQTGNHTRLLWTSLQWNFARTCFQTQWTYIA